jgi:hypothetical protein
MISNRSKKNQFWPVPKSKSVGLFTDFSLYYDALRLCKSLGIINLNVLQKELSERVIGIRYIEQLKTRAFLDLIRELNEFKFIKQKDHNVKIDLAFYEITTEGLELIVVYETNKKQFLRILSSKMYELYTVPGWIIDRLWKINPTGQGQVIIPAPIKSWNPSSYINKNYSWNSHLEEQVVLTFNKVNSLITNSFPVDLNLWIYWVKNEYERLGSVKTRTSKNLESDSRKKDRKSFAPRRRLATAMRTSALQLLFSNEYNQVADYRYNTPIMHERSYMAWCPRLESLELIYYSDYYKEIPGRLLFPLTIFRKNTDSNDFEINNQISAPNGDNLHYYQPKWTNFKMEYIEVLYNVYQNLHNSLRILYVPLQDVRDEVCRILRISSLLFEKFLEEAFKESLIRKINFSIALETDIREDQRSGSQILRRPVYIQSIPHSLIAININ